MDDSLNSSPRLLSMADVPLTGARGIERVRQEIRTLDETVAKLQLERKRLLTLISPIHSIPLELIGEIFSLTLAQHLRSPTIKGMDQLVDLCLVCRRWREVAIATPQLWSALVLDSPFTTLSCSQATAWLERSKAIPKSLVIDSSMGCDEKCRHREDCSLERMPLVTLLTEGPGPLRHLSFICARSLCFENIQILLSQSQQTQERRPWDMVTTFSLETLEFWNHYQGTDEMYDEHVSEYPILENIPLSVTRLALHIADLPRGEGAEEDSLYILKLPESVLNRLTHFTFTCYMNATTILRILRFCSNVQVLCLELGWMEWSQPDESESNLDKGGDLLPALRNLRMKGLQLEAAQCLRAFRTPHLQKLEVEFATLLQGDGEYPPFAEILQGYINRSQCHSSLTHLRLHRAHVEDFYPILAKLTSLTNLALSSISTLSSTLFDNLSRWHVQDKPLPALKYLSLTDVPDSFSYHTLRDWLDARWTSGMGYPQTTVTQRCGQVREVDPITVYGEHWMINDHRRWKNSEKCGGYHQQEDWGFDEI